MKQNRWFVISLFACLILAGCSSAQPSPGKGGDLAVTKGCLACHAIDGTTKIGPSWVGLYGVQVKLSDGITLIADDSYLEESIRDPNAKIVEGYSPYSMPAIDLTTEEVQTLLAYIKSVK